MWHFIKQVIFDIDGVLTPSGSEGWNMLGLRRLRALMKKTPLIYTLCSGRQSGYAIAIIQALELFHEFRQEVAEHFADKWGGVRLQAWPCIIENGGIFYDPLAKRGMPNPELARKHVKTLQEIKTMVVPTLIRDHGCVEESGKDFCISVNPPLKEGHADRRVDIKEFFSVVCGALHEYEDFIEISYSESAVDITPKGISKASAVSFMLKNTGLTPEEVLGIGDSTGDMAWLSLVGSTAAPANGSDTLIVDYRSPYTITDGVYDILTKLCESGYRPAKEWGLS